MYYNINIIVFIRSILDDDEIDYYYSFYIFFFS